MATNHTTDLFPGHAGVPFDTREAHGHPWDCQTDTSFGEASSRTQATDPNRRETLRIRTPLPGLRGESKWLAKRPGPGPATPWSAKALTREVDSAAFRRGDSTVPLGWCTCVWRARTRHG